MGDEVTFQHQVSDTVAQTGVKILKDGLFAGWIRKGQLTIISGLLVEQPALRGVVVGRRTHEWAQGGGTNYSGQIDIL